MRNNNRENIVNDVFILEPHQEYCGDVTVRNNIFLEDYSSMFSKVTVEHGNVSLGDFAFINELYMPFGGEIFFRGRRPVIRHLQAPHLTVHIPKKCEHWTDFVQINNVQGVIVRRDID